MKKIACTSAFTDYTFQAIQSEQIWQMHQDSEEHHRAWYLAAVSSISSLSVAFKVSAIHVLLRKGFCNTGLTPR